MSEVADTRLSMIVVNPSFTASSQASSHSSFMCAACSQVSSNTKYVWIVSTFPTTRKYCSDGWSGTRRYGNPFSEESVSYATHCNEEQSTLP